MPNSQRSDYKQDDKDLDDFLGQFRAPQPRRFEPYNPALEETRYLSQSPSLGLIDTSLIGG